MIGAAASSAGLVPVNGSFGMPSTSESFGPSAMTQDAFCVPPAPGAIGSWSIREALSDGMMVTLSAYQPAKGRKWYITYGLRRYYLKDGEMKVRREGGLSLNFDEFSRLASVMVEINLFLTQVFQSTKTVRLTCEADIDALHLYIRDFVHNGQNASFDGKMRLVLEK